MDSLSLDELLLPEALGKGQAPVVSAWGRCQSASERQALQEGGDQALSPHMDVLGLEVAQALLGHWVLRDAESLYSGVLDTAPGFLTNSSIL